ncbi:MAG: YigZ family protein [Clostridia bacterium]|nr:YigZ family protein [Clostridia bacterium]
MEKYITISGESVSEYEEKRSRFIARAYPCESESEASEILNRIKGECWDARHNCYAYVLKDGSARFSDDSEPHGTAGKPILDCIMGSGAVDVIVIVTRYFGGVLLGTGGLVRAYSTSAKGALENAKKVLMCLGSEMAVNCSYSELKLLEKLIEKSGGNITDTVYTDSVRVFFTLKNEDIDAFNYQLTEVFSGKIEAETLDCKYFSFNI